MGFGVYLFFASLMIASMPIVWLIVPETSNISLEKMDDLFALPPRKAHGIVMQRAQDARDQRDAAGDNAEQYKEGEDLKATESRNEYV